MIQLLKSHTDIDIRNKLVMLYALNVLDLMFTLFLINTGHFAETNPLVRTYLRSPLELTLFKLVLPALCISLVAVLLRNATHNQRRRMNTYVDAVLLIYSAVILLHVVYVGLYAAILA